MFSHKDFSSLEKEIISSKVNFEKFLYHFSSSKKVLKIKEICFKNSLEFKEI
ncbi:MAG: hypothetical protein LBQ24_03605 [Candidatus Peribacteria bacterium]|nr:hypothetical protein [Candidatus Peribacteria bacterium]